MAVQVAAVAVVAAVLHHVADARLVRIQAGEQARPGRAAAGRVVELREPQAAGGQPVEVRRVDLAAVAADVREAHVVGEDDDDVRPAARENSIVFGRRQAPGTARSITISTNKRSRTKFVVFMGYLRFQCPSVRLRLACLLYLG